MSDPEDATVMSLLALGLVNLERSTEAVEVARRAISTDPELSFAHFALGHAFFASEDIPAAEAAAREALRLNPDSDAYALLGHIQARKRRWGEVLETVETGLALDPYHTGCANLRAKALSALGRSDEAEALALETLAANPEDAASHANHGFLLLRQQKVDEALESFRTALRLDPGLETARAGILEALKARNGAYRVILRWMLWMANLDSRTQWFVLIGLFFVARIAREVLRQNPSLWPVLGPALAAYLVFALGTWLSVPLGNLLLRLNPFGRMVLSRSEMLASNIVGACLATTVVTIGLGIATATGGLVFVGLAAFLMLMPVSGAFAGHGTRAWRTLCGALIALATLAVATAVVALVSPANVIAPLGALAIGSFGFGWLANYLSIKHG